MNKTWKFIKNKDTVLEKVSGRDHYWYYPPEFSGQTDTMMVKVIVPKNSGHDFHRHPEMDEILYILKGTAEQWIADEMQVLETGDSVHINANVVHGTFNIGDDDLEFLAMLGPKKGWEAGTIDESLNLPYSNYRKKK